MKKIPFIAALWALNFFAHADTEKYTEDWESLKNYQAPEWYEDAKLGYWVHWGIYTVPAYKGDHDGAWYGRWMYSDLDGRGKLTHLHHVDRYGNPADFGYKDFIPMFKAEKFNPDEWLDLFVEGGAKFFTMMGVHHDSYCLWESQFSPWNSGQTGPKRDFVAEMAKATRDRGLKFGVSNHLAWNYMFFIWNHLSKDKKSTVKNSDAASCEGLYGDPIYTKDLDDISENSIRYHVKPSEKDFQKWTQLTTELCDRYQPDLYYFDWGFNIPEYEDKRKYFGAHYYNKAMEWGKGTYGKPNVVLNYKYGAFPQGSAVLDKERGVAGIIEPMVWQTDDSIYDGDVWGYQAGTPIKSLNDVLDKFIDIVSKRGILMLSLAPKSDGSIPEDQQALVRGMGAWLKISGEAIYATRPWEFNQEKAKKKDGTDAVDIRFTQSKDDKTLYAIMLDWCDDAFVMSKLNTSSLDATKIQSITLLGSDAPVTWSLDAQGLHLTLGRKPAHDHAFAIKICLE